MPEIGRLLGGGCRGFKDPPEDARIGTRDPGAKNQGSSSG